MRKICVITTLILLGAVVCLSQTMPTEMRINTTEKKIRTIYDQNGRPVNQGQDRKGWHQITGSAALSSGKAMMALNTSTASGRQDVSFLTSASYRGTAWSLDTTNTNRYWIVPLSGTSFMVKSSDGADSATVHWKVEGE